MKKDIISQINKIQNDLSLLGVKRGDLLLIHASYKSMGEIIGGAKTFFDAVLDYLGEDGTLVMPSLSYDRVGADSPCFNLYETPSCVGYLSEYFRTNVGGAVRSLHATHSCVAKGKLQSEIILNHEKDETPVGKNSPFTKVYKYNGKVLFIGCGTNPNTLMHGVEEIANPPYFLNRNKKVNYCLNDGCGNIINRESYVHKFKIDGHLVAQRYCKIENLLSSGEIFKGKILNADSTLMLASAVWEKGVEKMKRDPFYFVEILK